MKADCVARSGVEPVGWPWILIDPISEPLTVYDLGHRNKVISSNVSTKTSTVKTPAEAVNPSTRVLDQRWIFNLQDLHP